MRIGNLEKNLVAIVLACGLLMLLMFVFPLVIGGQSIEINLITSRTNREARWLSVVEPVSADWMTIISSDYTLEITKTAPLTVEVGSLLTYTIVYTVTGNGIAPGATITDRVPPGTTFSSCAPLAICGRSGAVVTWTLDSLHPGSGTVTLTVQVDGSLVSGTLIANTAHLWDQSGKKDQDSAVTKVFKRKSWVYLPAVLRFYSSEIVPNGGFETGKPSPWRVEGDEVLPPPRVVTTDPKEGSFHLLLGNPDDCNAPDPGQTGHHFSTASQTIYVPGGEGTPILRFWYRVFTYDHLLWTNDKTGDSLDVYVGDELALQDNYENLPNPAPGCNNMQDSGWRTPDEPWGGDVYPDVLDLSEWKGKSVELRIELWTRWDGYFNTWAYLDDVRVETLP